MILTIVSTLENVIKLFKQLVGKINCLYFKIMSNIVFTDQEKELIFKYNIIQKLTPKGIGSYAAMTNEWSDNSKNYVSGLIVGYEKNNKIEYCTSKEDI